MARQAPDPLGVEVSYEELDTVKLARHRFHGDWNYSIRA
jgi:hypothetical protein